LQEMKDNTDKIAIVNVFFTILCFYLKFVTL
jgi:hypothetical protein